ncbi:MAG: hypothetical protein IKU83_01685 [Lachnospiraceae bacterium]|nr:hypothetical protein [Lachnospiraceae bacterium]
MEQHSEKGFVIAVIVGAALMTMIIFYMVVGFQMSQSLPPTLYYQGKTNEDWTTIYAGTGGSVGVNDKSIELEWLDTSALEVVGQISDVVNKPKKEFETNWARKEEIGNPIYRVEIEGTVWLMFEKEEQSGDMHYTVQHLFGSYEVE